MILPLPGSSPPSSSPSAELEPSSGAGSEVAPQLSAEELASRARAYAEAALAKNSRRAYAADWRVWAAWCTARGQAELPATPETVAAYLIEHAGARKISTLSRHLTTIRRAHGAADLDDPTDDERVRTVWMGIRREHGVGRTQKRALVAADLRRVLALVEDDLAGARDSALLCVGLATGMRRAELAALEVFDLGWEEQGVILRLRRSKTDQEGVGRSIALHYGRDGTCPVVALKRWLEVAGIEEGKIWRQVRYGRVLGPLAPQSIARMLKRRAAAAGLDETQVSGHSLRAGHVTQRYQGGDDAGDIMETTGHTKMETMLGYKRATPWRKNVTAAVDL